jgi:hypothetical protein
MVTMAGAGQPQQVHRARVSNRQPRPSQAGSGQQEDERQDAAPPEGMEHGAKLANALLLRKREGLEPARGTSHQPKAEQGEQGHCPVDRVGNVLLDQPEVVHQSRGRGLSITFTSGMPSHGTTMDQPSTHRWR